MKIIISILTVIFSVVAFGEQTPDILSLLSSPNPEIRKMAISKTTDNAVLKMAAIGDSDEKVRIAAVKKMTDQKMIAEIVFEKPSSEMTIAVLGESLGFKSDGDKITNQEILKELAHKCLRKHMCKKESEYDLLLLGSLDAITDEKFLMDVYEQEKEDVSVVYAVLKHVKNIQFLRELVVNPETPRGIVEEAMHGLPDDDVYIIATKFPAKDLRKKACKELVYYKRRPIKNVDAVIELALQHVDDGDLCNSICYGLSENKTPAALAKLLIQLDDNCKWGWSDNKISIKARYIDEIDDFELIDKVLDSATSEDVFKRAEVHVKELRIRNKALSADLFVGVF